MMQTDGHDQNAMKQSPDSSTPSQEMSAVPSIPGSEEDDLHIQYLLSTDRHATYLQISGGVPGSVRAFAAQQDDDDIPEEMTGPLLEEPYPASLPGSPVPDLGTGTTEEHVNTGQTSVSAGEGTDDLSEFSRWLQQFAQPSPVYAEPSHPAESGKPLRGKRSRKRQDLPEKNRDAEVREDVVPGRPAPAPDNVAETETDTGVDEILLRDYEEDPEMAKKEKKRKKKKEEKKKKEKKKKKKKKKKERQKGMLESLTMRDDIISEPLAHILASQGYNDEAIAMYEKLSLIYPEKSSFFAAEIRKLKQ